MTTQQAAEIFNKTLIGETNKDRIAKVELAREYFCNPKFRAHLENELALLNGINQGYPKCICSNPLPQKKCAWEKFEGLYELGAAEQIGKWLVSTQKISMEVKGAGGKCSLVNSLPSGSNIPNGEVTLAAYICK